MLPDFGAQSSPTGNRESAQGSDAGARGAESGDSKIKALLGLVVVAFVAKLAMFGLAIGTSTSLSLPNAENWQDFALAYAPAAQAFMHGFLPYRDFFYPYPPLFLWSLAALSPFPFASWLAGLPLVAADALTTVPVYLIARQLAGDRNSKLVSILFIFAPTNLYYADYLLLNPPLTTLLLLTSVYLLLRGRYGWSSLVLALSVGMKQTALFALPVVLLIVWKRTGRKSEALRYLAAVASVCLAFSLPYLVASPVFYVESILRLPLGTFGPAALPSGYYSIGFGYGTQVTFDTSNWLTSRWALLAEGVYSPATLALPFFLLLAPTALFGLYSSLPLDGVMYSVLLAGFALVLRAAFKVRRWDGENILRYALYSMLVVFTFYPLYKYYIVGLVPFLVLLVRNKKEAVGFIAFTLAFMLIPRYLASWALLVSLVLLLWGRRNSVLPGRGRTQPMMTDMPQGTSAWSEEGRELRPMRPGSLCRRRAVHLAPPRLDEDLKRKGDVS